MFKDTRIDNSLQVWNQAVVHIGLSSNKNQSSTSLSLTKSTVEWHTIAADTIYRHPTATHLPHNSMQGMQLHVFRTTNPSIGGGYIYEIIIS